MPVRHNGAMRITSKLGRRRPARRTLLLGGARSGKSATAERMLTNGREVLYVATGGTRDGDAESWVGETWKELLEGGIDQVVLLEDGEKVYGPMNLHPEEQ